MNPADTTTRFRGMMEGIRLLDVVQLCCRTAATCCVWVKNSHRSGFLWLADGEFVHAESGDLRGEEAAIAILTWHCGSFAIHNQVTTRETSISTKWEALVMKAACTLDERRQDEGAEERIASVRSRAEAEADESTPPMHTETFASEADIEEAAPLRVSRKVPTAPPPVLKAEATRPLPEERAEAPKPPPPAARAESARPPASPARAKVKTVGTAATAASAEPVAEPAARAQADAGEPAEATAAGPQTWLPGLGQAVYELSCQIGEALGLGLLEAVTLTGVSNQLTLELDADGSARVSWAPL